MNTERWQRVQQIFADAAELSPPARAAFLDSQCAGDRELRDEIDSLFAYDSPESGPPLVAAVRDVAASLLNAESMVGRKVGPYRLTRPLGTGGMGIVYLGMRDDAQFEQTVAIKLVRGGLNTESVLGRFRYERQILAQLDHPYVAKLLDGGTTSDGLPYFVMEYVEGTPIHRYCATHKFTIGQKCELFAKVCEAVSYAHRNLVVHRDLKPSNIMVTEDGTPKLLDFGIAKLLTPEVSEATVGGTTGLQVAMTPDYASPEQVVGGAINTTTDVYSLGAVLYELLTGTRPHRISSLTPLALERAICLTDVRRPSSVVEGGLRRQLSGDLDNILLMAMRKEPLRRYQSVMELRDDIQRYLKGLPVAAREDTLFYRTGKFVRRHHVGVLAASLIFLVLAGGVVATDRERKVANEQRLAAEKQRESADRERARAESAQAEAKAQRDAAMSAQQKAESESNEAGVQRHRAEERLSTILSLVDKSMLSIEEAVSTLPGATEIRKKIVEEAVKNLDQIAVQAGEDRRVSEATVAGYLALGDVQGFPSHPNLGDSAGARHSYDKAAKILSGLLQRLPNDPEILTAAVGVYQRSGELMEEQGHHAEAKAELLKGLASAEKLAEVEPGKRRSTVQVALMHHSLAQMQLQHGEVEAGGQHARQEQALYSKLVEANPKDTEAVNALASSYLMLAQADSYGGRLAEGVEYLRKAVRVREELTARFPNDVLIARNLMITYGRLGDNLGGPYLSRNLGDAAGATANYRKALAIAERLEHADAKDRLAKSDLATILMRLGMVLERPEEQAESIAVLQRSESIASELAKADPTSQRERRLLILVDEYLGHRLEAQGKITEALNQYRTSLEISEALLLKDPTSGSVQMQLMADYKALALLLAKLGRRGESLQFVDKLVALSEKLAATGSLATFSARYPARSYAVAGAVYETLARAGSEGGDWSQAKAWFARGRDGWVKLANDPAQRPVENEIAEMSAKVAECDRHIGSPPRQ